MNEIDTTSAPTAASNPQPGISPLHAIVDVAKWLWPRRRLVVAELRAAQARGRARTQPKRPTPKKLRFAV